MHSHPALRSFLPALRTHERSVLLALLLGALAPTVSAFTRQGTALLTDGSLADVNAALNAAVAGDEVRVPAGSFTWGDNGSTVNVSKPVQLVGAGPGQTIISISSTAGNWTNAVIRVSAGAVARDFTVRGAAGSKSAFATFGNGWRITNITYLGVSGEGYFVYTSGGYGLIDSCNITGGAGNSELIFSRGPTDSWQTPSSMGSADAVYIEDCTFNTNGYVCDMNSNARGVVRFSTMNAIMKVDSHGVASNTPDRSARQIEIYGNKWTFDWAGTHIEVRGGTARIFANRAASLGEKAWFYLREYGCISRWPNFNNTYQTPINYPIKDQIGVGTDPKVAGAEPVYIWDMRAQNNADWPLNWFADLSGAIDLYRVQTGNPTATFTKQDIIAKDRDYFREDITKTFDGSSGVGVGTKAQMNAIRGLKKGVGYWVTDEGEWNSTNGATPDGQLYVWNGTAWEFNYLPYTYPHPLRGAGAPNNVRIRVDVR
jgi:hypothetical protein